jgi:hypothetical protein
MVNRPAGTVTIIGPSPPSLSWSRNVRHLPGVAVRFWKGGWSGPRGIGSCLWLSPFKCCISPCNSWVRPGCSSSPIQPTMLAVWIRLKPIGKVTCSINAGKRIFLSRPRRASSSTMQHRSRLIAFPPRSRRYNLFASAVADTPAGSIIKYYTLVRYCDGIELRTTESGRASDDDADAWRGIHQAKDTACHLHLGTRVARCKRTSSLAWSRFHNWNSGYFRYALSAT